MSQAIPRPSINCRRGVALVVLVGVVVASRTASAGTWYVSPAGSPDAGGTRESPWDIASALVGTQPVKPGDTVYLLPGTYRRRPVEQFDLRLAGAEGKPIHVRPPPGLAPGERAMIDGGLQVLEPAAHVWVWDLEILVSEPQPTEPVGPGSHPEGFTRPWGGLNVHGGAHCKYINLVIHDCRQGVSFWRGATDSELHGCLIYDNSWPAVDRGHGHAVYTQNDQGLKTISDNIMTGGHSYTPTAPKKPTSTTSSSKAMSATTPAPSSSAAASPATASACSKTTSTASACRSVTTRPTTKTASCGTT